MLYPDGDQLTRDDVLTRLGTVSIWWIGHHLELKVELRTGSLSTGEEAIAHSHRSQLKVLSAVLSQRIGENILDTPRTA